MPNNREFPIWHPWHEAEFQRDPDVQRMTPHQRLFYRCLLQTSYYQCTFLPFDHDKLWWLAGCENKQEWLDNCASILPKFVVNEKFKFMLSRMVVRDSSLYDSTASTIYFLRGRKTGNIKIGMSEKNPAKRLKHLQTGSSEPLDLVATAFGGKEVEKILHCRFSSSKIIGEWFSPTPDLLSTIEAHKCQNE